MEGQDPRDLEEFEYALASSFDRVSATTLEKVDQFADEEAKAVRKAVKQAAIDNGLKLERVRTASNVSLKNQQAELQAEFDRTLEAKILSLSEGGDAVLREATKRLQDASEELAELKTKHSSQEEQLKMARKELEASKKMIAQAAEAQEALKECFLVLKLSPTEEKVLLTAIKELHAAACGVVQSNDEERTEMEKKNAALEQQLVKAAADADTALAQRDEQAQRQLDELRAAFQTKLEEARAANNSSDLVAESAAKLAAVQDELGAQVSSLQIELSAAQAKARAVAEEHDAALEKLARAEAQLAEFNNMPEVETTGDDDAAQVAALRREVAKLKAEMADTKGSLSKTLKDLNITVDENKSLAQQINEMLEKMGMLKSEVDQSKEALNETLTQLGITVDENKTLTEKLKILRDTTETLNNEIDDCKQALQETLVKLGITVDENKTLSERMRTLTEASQKASLEIRDCREQLEVTLEKLGIARDENKTLCERLADLTAASKTTVDELHRMKAALDQVTTHLGIKVDENKTLAEHIEDLAKKYTDLKLLYDREMAQGAGGLKALKEQGERALKQEQLRAKQALQEAESRRQMEAAHLEVEKQHAEVERAKAMEETKVIRMELASQIEHLKKKMIQYQKELNEALSSLLEKSQEHEKVQQQMRDLARRYRMAEGALVHMSKELGSATIALEQATQAKLEAHAKVGAALSDAEQRVGNVVQAARVERELLTKAALRAVKQMQEHVTNTLGWLGSLHSTPDTPSLPSKARHRWGFTGPGADPCGPGAPVPSAVKVGAGGSQGSSPRGRSGELERSTLPPMPYSARPPNHAANSVMATGASATTSIHQSGMRSGALSGGTVVSGAKVFDSEAWPQPPSQSHEGRRNKSLDGTSREPQPPSITTANGSTVRSFAEAAALGETERVALTDCAVALARTCLREAVSLEKASVDEAGARRQMGLQSRRRASRVGLISSTP